MDNVSLFTSNLASVFDSSNFIVDSTLLVISVLYPYSIVVLSSVAFFIKSLFWFSFIVLVCTNSKSPSLIGAVVFTSIALGSFPS